MDHDGFSQGAIHGELAAADLEDVGREPTDQLDLGARQDAHGHQFMHHVVV